MSVRIGCIGLLVQQKSKKKSKLHWKQFLIILSNYIYMHLIFKKFLLLHFHCLMKFYFKKCNTILIAFEFHNGIFILIDLIALFL